MSFQLIIQPKAEEDLANQRDWYDGQRDGLGSDFLQAAEDVFERIQQTPELYAEEYRGVRRVQLQRFPFIVYYRLLQNTVEVLAVLHASRDDRSWKSRARG